MKINVGDPDRVHVCVRVYACLHVDVASRQLHDERVGVATGAYIFLVRVVVYDRDTVSFVEAVERSGRQHGCISVLCHVGPGRSVSWEGGGRTGRGATLRRDRDKGRRGMAAKGQQRVGQLSTATMQD